MLKDAAAIVGIGETPFAKKRDGSEKKLAAEAIIDALDDAGIDASEVDGLASYTMEGTDEVEIAKNVGTGDVTFRLRTEIPRGVVVIGNSRTQSPLDFLSAREHTLKIRVNQPPFCPHLQVRRREYWSGRPGSRGHKGFNDLGRVGSAAAWPARNVAVGRSPCAGHENTIWVRRIVGEGLAERKPKADVECASRRKCLLGTRLKAQPRIRAPLRFHNNVMKYH